MSALIFALAVLAPLAPTARAAPRAEAQFITAHLMKQGLDKAVRTTIGRSYGAHYSKWLRARSVNILDYDRFVAELPAAATERYVAHFERQAAERCFAKFPDEELRAAVADIRQNPEARPRDEAPGPLVLDLDAPQAFEEDLKQRLDDASSLLREDARTRVELAGTLCIVTGVVQYGHLITASPRVRPDPVADEVARILATPGVARFPNRIAREDILRELRGLRRIAPPADAPKSEAKRPWEPQFRRVPAHKPAATPDEKG